MKCFFKSLAIYAAVLLSLAVRAEPIDATRDNPEAIGKHIEYFIEDASPLNLNEAAQAYAAERFTASESSFLDFGIGAKPIWLRFEVVNPEDAPVTRRLSLETSWIDKVDVYFLPDGAASEIYHAGDTLPFSERPIEDRFFIFPHLFQPGVTRVFMRVETPDPLVLPIYLTSIEAAHSRQIFEGYSYGFLYGLIFALLAYNLMLYFSLKNNRYLYYSIYLGAFLIANAAYTGHGYRWLWPDSPHWQLWSNPILMMLFGISGLVFAARFLNIKTYFPRLYRVVIRGCIGFAALQALAVITGNQVAALLLSFSFVFLFSAGMVLLGAISLAAGNKSAKYFLFASVTHVSSSAVTAMAVWGLIPYSILAYRAVEIGMVIDAILLAMALADQFRIIQGDKINAERLARVDPLTGMNNRRAFHELVKPIWSTAHRRQKDVSVILLDVDRFKSINDTYGHAHGDHVLRHMGRVLMENARTGDILARWGGEEFILFLPETKLDEAVIIAERFRHKVSKMHLGMEYEMNPITASFGVAHTNKSAASLEDLISTADVQLYKAKELGRDRVCSDKLLS